MSAPVVVSSDSLPSRLLAALEPWRDAPGFRVAFSGGLDSTVLLHVLAGLARCEGLPPLSALHVHHGLQAAADAWPAHCQQVCDGLSVPLRILPVVVAPGASLEAAARDARYRAFEQTIQQGEVLLTGQHRDDQAETLLFRLLRGAGVRGLAAMPAQRELGGGTLLRPLLAFSRSELLSYAQAHGLQWVEDPSNLDEHYSRNYLRRTVLPLLAQRWPQALTSLSRSAAHLREAQGLLDELALMDLQAARQASDWRWLGLPSLALGPLQGLSPARQRNALRHWLAAFTRLPDSDHWAGWQTLRDAAADAQPVWRLEQGELRRAEGRLWWLSGDWLQAPPPPNAWADTALPLELSGNGRVLLSGGVLPGQVTIRYRDGGEVLQLPGRGHRDLKRLLNESGLPAFARGRLPLLYQHDQLLAVANLPGLDGAAHGEWRLKWLPATNDQCLS